jgi:hypothetical protein
MDRAFSHALNGVKAEDGKQSKTINKDLIKCIVVQDGSRVRSLTVSSPVSVHAALMGPVEAEQRKDFLSALCKKTAAGNIDSSFGTARDLLAVQQTAREGMTEDKKFYSELAFNLIRNYMASLPKVDELSSVCPQVSVTQDRGGYHLTSTVDLATGRSKETRYDFTHAGDPIVNGSTQWGAGSPVDCLIKVPAIKRDTYVWSRTSEQGEWQANTHWDYSPGGNQFDHAQYSDGFSDGIKALLSVQGLYTKAQEEAQTLMATENQEVAKNIFAELSVPPQRDDGREG